MAMDKLQMKVIEPLYGYTIDLYEDKIVCEPGSRKPTTIYIKDIVSVESISKPTFWVAGRYRIVYDNTYIEKYYVKNYAPQIDKFLERLLELQAISQGKPVGEDKNKTPLAEDKTLKDIQMLAVLRDKGILTEDEFQAKKRQILFPGQSGTYVEKQIVREIVKIPCPYCGVLYEITATKCPSCGAPYKK